MGDSEIDGLTGVARIVKARGSTDELSKDSTELTVFLPFLFLSF